MIDIILDLIFTTNGNALLAMPWWAPIAVSAGVGLGKKLLSGGAQRKDDRRASQSRRRREEAIEGTTDALGRLAERADAVKEDYTVDDLYGPIITRLTDRMQADTDQAEMNAFRAMLASGGDMSGTGATTVNRIAQSGQEGIQNLVARFAEMTTGRNLQESVRKDQLLSGTASGYSNLAGLLSGITSDEQLRADQRRQANNQFGLDLLGIGTQVAGFMYE